MRSISSSWTRLGSDLYIIIARSSYLNICIFKLEDFNFLKSWLQLAAQNSFSFHFNIMINLTILYQLKALPQASKCFIMATLLDGPWTSKHGENSFVIMTNLWLIYIIISLKSQIFVFCTRTMLKD